MGKPRYSSSTSLATLLVAARRYSRTCNPNTDSWLRSAWPGLSDVELTEACLRDGRWHYLGTMVDIVTRALTLPAGMEVGVSTYSDQITPVTVNSWTQGTRLCGAPIAVGDTASPTRLSFVHQCVTAVGTSFTVTHNRIDGSNATDVSQRVYTGYTGSNERSLQCFESGTVPTCATNQSLARYWRIYVRQ